MSFASKKSCLLCGLLVAWMAVAGEVDPAYQAEYQTLQNLVEQFEEKYFGHANEHEGVLYEFTNLEGHLRKVRLQDTELTAEMTDWMNNYASDNPVALGDTPKTEEDTLPEEKTMAKTFWERFEQMVEQGHQQEQEFNRRIAQEIQKNGDTTLYMDGKPVTPEIGRIFEEQKQWQKNSHIKQRNFLGFENDFTELFKQVKIWQSLGFTPVAETNDTAVAYNKALAQLDTYRYQNNPVFDEDLVKEREALKTYVDQRCAQLGHFLELGRQLLDSDAEQVKAFDNKMMALNAYLPDYLRMKPDKSVAAARSNANAPFYKKKTLPLVQQIQTQLQDLLKQQAMPADRLVALQDLLWPIKEENFRVYSGAQEEGVPYNAYNDSLKQELAITAEFLADLPDAAIKSTLAHEIGHSISVNAYLGNIYHLSTYDQTTKERMAGKELSKKNQEGLRAWIKNQEKTAGNELDNYPFKSVLAHYAQLGVDGLRYFDPRYHDRLDQQLKEIWQVWLAQGNGVEVLEYEEEGSTSIKYEFPIPDQYLAEDKMYLNFYLENQFQNIYYQVQSKLSPELQAAFEEDQGFQCRAEEVMADHFSRMIIENEVRQIADKAAQRKFVEEAVIDFLVYITPQDVTKYGAKFPNLISPEYQEFLQKKKAAEDGNEVFIITQTLNADDHPTHPERLLIYFSSPVLQEALQG